MHFYVVTTDIVVDGRGRTAEWLLKIWQPYQWRIHKSDSGTAGTTEED